MFITITHLIIQFPQDIIASYIIDQDQLKVAYVSKTLYVL